MQDFNRDNLQSHQEKLTLMELGSGASNSPSASYSAAFCFMFSISKETSLPLASVHSARSYKISIVLVLTLYSGIGSFPYIFFSHKVICQRRGKKKRVNSLVKQQKIADKCEKQSAASSTFLKNNSYYTSKGLGRKRGDSFLCLFFKHCL